VVSALLLLTGKCTRSGDPRRVFFSGLIACNRPSGHYHSAPGDYGLRWAMRFTPALNSPPLSCRWLSCCFTTLESSATTPRVWTRRRSQLFPARSAHRPAACCSVPTKGLFVFSRSFSSFRSVYPASFATGIAWHRTGGANGGRPSTGAHSAADWRQAVLGPAG